MPLSLSVDGKRWRTHLSSMLNHHPGLVPVIKGNGYGFGLSFLADEASRMGVETVAVGLASEVMVVRSSFKGEIIILSPDGLENSELDEKCIVTISDLVDLKSIDKVQDLIIEIGTPLQRHGISLDKVPAAVEVIATRNLHCRGFTLHLPIADFDAGWVRRALTAIPSGSTVWVSHVPHLSQLRMDFPTLTFRERIGTHLWLGDDAALTVTATVLENRKITGVAGYRQRKIKGNVIVASGGTSHGIGLSAPNGDRSVLGRTKSFARAIEALLGRDRSPYKWNGKVLDFFEPPHMQCSMLVHRGSDQPKVGDELELRVRYTTTTFDQVNIR